MNIHEVLSYVGTDAPVNAPAGGDFTHDDKGGIRLDQT